MALGSTLPHAARGTVLAFAVVVGTALSAAAGEINVQGGAAISGYDPVAYFDEGRPVEGAPAFTATYRGAEFRFASDAHRAAFAADPARYAPQFGGFCAYAVSRGYKAPIDPAAFTIVDGKLYLNYDMAVQSIWRGDVAGYVEKAEHNWPTVKDR